MSLKAYKNKRNLKKSKEPAPIVRKKRAKELQFVVQKHAATRLHYDFCYEAKREDEYGRYNCGKKSVPSM